MKLDEKMNKQKLHFSKHIRALIRKQQVNNYNSLERKCANAVLRAEVPGAR